MAAHWAAGLGSLCALAKCGEDDPAWPFLCQQAAASLEAVAVEAHSAGGEAGARGDLWRQPAFERQAACAPVNEHVKVCRAPLAHAAVTARAQQGDAGQRGQEGHGSPLLHSGGRRRDSLGALALPLAQLLMRYCPGHPALGQALAAAAHCLRHLVIKWGKGALAPEWSHESGGGCSSTAGGSAQLQQEQEQQQHPLGSPDLAAFLLRGAPMLMRGALGRQQGMHSRQGGAEPPGCRDRGQHFQHICTSLMGGAKNLVMLEGSSRWRWYTSELLAAALAGWGRLALRHANQEDAGKAWHCLAAGSLLPRTCCAWPRALVAPAEACCRAACCLVLVAHGRGRTWRLPKLAALACMSIAWARCITI